MAARREAGGAGVEAVRRARLIETSGECARHEEVRGVIFSSESVRSSDLFAWKVWLTRTHHTHARTQHTHTHACYTHASMHGYNNTHVTIQCILCVVIDACMFSSVCFEHVLMCVSVCNHLFIDFTQ